MARPSVPDERRTSQRLPEAQYRSAPQQDPRSRPSERLGGASRRNQPQLQQKGRSPESDFSSVRSDSRPSGIPIIERKQVPAERRQDVDGRYGRAPSVGSPSADRARSSAAPVDESVGRMEELAEQASDRRPTFEEFLRAEQTNAQVCRQSSPAPDAMSTSGCLSRASRRAEHLCIVFTGGSGQQQVAMNLVSSGAPCNVMSQELSPTSEVQTGRTSKLRHGST